jgi:enoyl-CoA hydratase
MNASPGGPLTPKVIAELDDSVLTVRFDDGKANALSVESIRQLDEALAIADGARAVCILGRPGFFCVGYDLGELGAGADRARELVKAGRSLVARLVASDVPTVAGVSGHALAAGAALTLACDFRIGSRGPFRLGFNEITNGLTLSESTVELAVRRLAPSTLEKLILDSQLCDPDHAVRVGLLDSVVEPSELESAALAQAQRLARFDPGALRVTKARLRSIRSGASGSDRGATKR